MNTTDALAQLKDIHPPEPISWWPLALGWWVVIAIALTLCAAIIFWRVKRRRQRRHLKRAQIELQALVRAELSAADFIEAVNSTLKRVALHPSRHSCADIRIGGLSGRAWLEFLDQSLSPSSATFCDGVGRALGENAYRPNPEVNRQAVIALAKRWVRQHQISDSGNTNNLKTQEPKHV